MQRRTFFGTITAAIAGLFVPKVIAEPKTYYMGVDLASPMKGESITVTNYDDWEVGYSKVNKAPATVHVLRHNPNTHYEILRVFDTEEEAIDLVRNLYPRIFQVTLRHSDNSGVVSSGYREAARFYQKNSDIISLIMEIIDKRTGEVIVPWDFDWRPIIWPMYSVERAWSVIENIRVNNEPVDLMVDGKYGNSRIHPLITMPFDKGKDNIHYIREDFENDITTYTHADESIKKGN